MWSTAEPSERAWSDKPIEPVEVLYEFDGPLTFIATFGMFQALFHKIGQRSGSHFFCVVELSDHQLECLKSGNLSVRGALHSHRLWVMETTSEIVVKRYWASSIENMPEKLLPRRGIGLYPHFLRCPDLIEQVDAFFSMAYVGPRLKPSGTPFTIFKNIIDASYNAARRVLSPLEFAGARSGTFDFPARAIPGSLVVVLDAPRIGQTQLQKRMNNRKATVEDARGIFAHQRTQFLDEIEELLKAAANGGVGDAIAEERYSLLDNLQHIIPSDENEIDSVEFTAPMTASIRSIIVNEEYGSELYRALRRVESKSITDIGRVEIVNSPSRTFVYRSTRGRAVTCFIDGDEFVRLEKEGFIKIGAGIKVRGILKRRERRDSISPEILPEFLDE